MTYKEYTSYIKEQEKLPDSDFNYPAVRQYHNCYLFLGKHEKLDLYIHIEELRFLYKKEEIKILDMDDPTNCNERQEVLSTFNLRINDVTVYGNGSGEYYTTQISIERYYNKFSKYTGYRIDETGEMVPVGKMRENENIAKERLYGLEILKRWNQFIFNHFIKKETNNLIFNTNYYNYGK